MHPPKKAIAFLRWFCREDYIEEIEGDLTEVFRKEQESAPHWAKWKFVWSVFRYFRPEFIKPQRNYSPLNRYGMYKSYFKIGWRHLLGNKIYSSINIIGLAIGVTVAMLTGLWIWDELTFNHIHQNHHQIAGVWVTTTYDGEKQSGPAISIPLGAELKNNYSSQFKNLALSSWNWNHLIARSNETSLLKEGMYTEATFPEMFSLQAVEGDLSSALAEPYSIVLSESVARALFANESAVGKTLRLDNTYDVKVTGVYRDFPISSEFNRVKLLLPWLLHEKDSWVKNNLTNWENHSWQLFAEIEDHHSMDAISELIAGVEKKNNQTGNPTLFLHPMDRWHLYEEFKDGSNTGGSIQYVWLFGTAGIFIVLLACINFTNLSTARSEKRAHEVGVRKIIGSVKSQLMVQFLGEAFFITTLSVVLALLLTYLLLPFCNELAGKEIAIPFDNYKFWVVIMLFSVITALLAGGYPAFYLSSLQPLSILKGKLRIGKFAIGMRQALVVFQFTISTVLIAGTLIVYTQLEFSKNRSLGYSKERLVYTGIIPEMKGRYDELRHELLQTGAVTEMSQSSGPTTDIWSNETDFNWEGKSADSEPIFATLSCTHDFGRTIHWKIKEGRDFSRDFSTDSLAVIVNESAAKLIGAKDIVGKVIKHDGETFHIIGVTEDMVMESPYAAIRPTIFNLDYTWSRVTNFRLAPDIPVQEALAKVQSVFKKLSPSNVFEFRFADSEYDAKFASENRVSKLTLLFATLTIFIACLGLLGLSIFIAEQRQKELSIRKILGASVFNITALLSKDFLRLVVLSIVIASPISYYFSSKWLQNFTYRIDVNWWVFGLAGIAAIVIAFATVSYQSIKTATSNPVNSLKSE